jgi:hypothetical protein
MSTWPLASTTCHIGGVDLIRLETLIANDMLCFELLAGTLVSFSALLMLVVVSFWLIGDFLDD